MTCKKDLLKNGLLLIVAAFMSGCAVHQFPVVRPVQEFPREINTKIKAQEYFIRARDYERRGLDQSAERYYEMAYELDPASRVLQEQVARKYIEGGKYSQALVLLKRDKKNSELDRESKRLVSTVYIKMGEFAKAAEVLESIEGLNEEELFSLGLIYESLGRVDKALNSYLEFYRKMPESGQMGIKIGNLLMAEKRYDEAESLFVSIKENEGETPGIFTMLGNVNVARGDTAAGLSYYQSALALDSIHEETLRNMAQVYLGRNDYQKAIAVYEKLYGSGQYGEIYGRTLGFLYYFNKQYDRAEELIARLLQESIDDYELHYYLGLVFAASGKNDLANMEFEKTLSIKSSFEEAWRDLCYLHIREKDFDRALSVAERCVAVLPQSAASWRLKAMVYNTRKEYGAAIEALGYSLARDSSSVISWFELGSAHERNKQYEMAANAFRKVLALRPGDPAASNYLGYMWADIGVKLDTAKVLLEVALKQDPENGAFLDSYAWIFFKMGEIDSAYAYIQKAVEKIGDDPVLFSHLGDILARRNDLTGAIEAYRKSLEHNTEEAEVIRKKISELQILIQRSGN
ncbi:MAG: tetratricopeptide repeat protein [Fibrobacter sp.]|nr:tetratricopeptide repeat protein [Fibrobacter sp.]